jgi:LmbE family N-acetylglucosaminyl deacetylase
VVTAIGHRAWEALGNKASPLTPDRLRALSPLAILAPHPDDETLGCGGLLAAAADLGLQAKVAFLTDGAASHRGSAAWPPVRLARIRKAEALSALAILGVPASDVLFLNWPDAAPWPQGSDGFRQGLERLSAWLGTFQPKSLWAPWRGERHCDHQAASLLADALVRARRPRLRRFDYMVWGWAEDDLAETHGADVVWRLSCARFAARRRRALARHATQTTDLIDDAEQAFLIPPDLAALVERPFDIFLERL